MKTRYQHNIARKLSVLLILPAMISLCSAGAYLKLGDIKGESTDNDHKDWIIIESMSAPAAEVLPNSDGTCRVGLRQRGDTTLGDIVVVRELDKSSTKLQEAVCNGTSYGEATVDLVSAARPGSKPGALRYTLLDVFVENYRITAGTNARGEVVPMESFSLNYGAVRFEYLPQKSKKP